MLHLEAYHAILQAARHEDNDTTCNNTVPVGCADSARSISTSLTDGENSIAGRSAIAYVNEMASGVSTNISPCTVCHVYFANRAEQVEHYHTAEHVLALKKRYKWSDDYLVDRRGRLVKTDSENVRRMAREGRLRDFVLRRSNILADLVPTENGKDEIEHYTGEVCYADSVELNGGSAFEEYESPDATDKPFLCSICCTSFATEAGLEKHYKSKKHFKLSGRFEEQLRRDEEERKLRGFPESTSLVVEDFAGELSSSLMSLANCSNFGFSHCNDDEEVEEEEEEEEGDKKPHRGDLIIDDNNINIDAALASTNLGGASNTHDPAVFVVPNKFTVKNKQMLNVAEKRRSALTISAFYETTPKEKQIVYLYDKLEEMKDQTLSSAYDFLVAALSNGRNNLIQSEIELLESRLFDCICYLYTSEDEEAFKMHVYEDIIAKRPGLDSEVCVFCGEKIPALTSNGNTDSPLKTSQKLLHWLKCSGFVIRFAEALKSDKLESCIAFVESIISRYYQCIQCSKTFKSFKNVRDHIRSTGHIHMPLMPAMVDQFYNKEKLDSMLHDMHDMLVREIARKDVQADLNRYINSNKAIIDAKKRECAIAMPQMSSRELELFLSLKRAGDVTVSKSNSALKSKEVDVSKMLAQDSESNSELPNNENGESNGNDNKDKTQTEGSIVRIPKEKNLNLPAWYRREMSSAIWCYESQKAVNKINVSRNFGCSKH